MKKIHLKTKIIAAVLSAVTVFSVTAMTTTTAFAAETKISAGTHITNDRKLSLDRDMNYAVKITSSTLMKVLEGTKYGKVLAPLLGGVLDAFIEKSEERIEKKVTELSDKVDRIFEKLDASEASIKAELMDCGYNSWKFSEWNYTKPGNACILLIK